jgi:large subunit ribosomal protein L9
MKVLLIKDVYKLGHAGDIKKVADGYGRNYLIPQKLAVLATPGALKQADRIREEGSVMRASLNQELSGLAETLSGLMLTFSAKAGEADKLYGSITHRMIAEELEKVTGAEISAKAIDSQPIRTIGIHMVRVRLTVDLLPEVKVVVYREGETAAMVLEAARLAEEEAAQLAEEELEELIEEEILEGGAVEEDAVEMDEAAPEEDETDGVPSDEPVAVADDDASDEIIEETSEDSETDEE